MLTRLNIDKDNTKIGFSSIHDMLIVLFMDKVSFHVERKAEILVEDPIYDLVDWFLLIEEELENVN